MQKADLHPDERTDTVNFGIRLIEKVSGLTFGTDALLLASFLRAEKNSVAAELGGGSGIISLLSLALDKFRHIDCIEIQESYADLIARNAEENGMSDRLTVHAADIREYAVGERCGRMDAVFANPPYMPLSGAANAFPEKNIARHEVFGGIEDFCAVAARLLRYGGRFSVVYRPDRLIDLITAMRAHRIEPKEMILVCADAKTPPSTVLIEGILGGKPSLKVLPPLIVYRHTREVSPRVYTDTMQCLSETGKFPFRSE